ncbi:hypothetical protein [Streptomyces chartreusis]|uniref:hypothetical protein n=1 Tax=Streptomyces chartreusis TaxID=1969 RepID=UPI00341DE637
MQLIKDGVHRVELTAPEATGDLRQAALFLRELDDLYVKCAALAFLAQVPGEEEVEARSELVAQFQAAATVERPRIEQFQSGSLTVILAAALPLVSAALEVFSLALTNVEQLWTLPGRIKAANAKSEMEITQAYAAKAEAEAAIKAIKGGHGTAVDYALVGRRQAMADLAAQLAERALPEVDESLRTLRGVSGGQLDVKADPEDFARDWPTAPSSRPEEGGDAATAMSW